MKRSNLLSVLEYDHPTLPLCIVVANQLLGQHRPANLPTKCHPSCNHVQVNISSKSLRETFDSMISETWVMKCVIRRNSWCESSSDGLPTLTLASQHNIPLPSVWSLASVCFDHCLFTMEELELPRKLVYRSENQYLGRNLQTSPIMHSWLDRYVQSCGKLALCRSTNSNLLMVESKSVRINLYC